MLLRENLAPLALKAYLELRDAIVHSRLAPGHYLSEPQLTEDLGVSRTPIRSALQALIQDGLVRTSPGRGAVVSDVTAQDIRDLFELRIGIEGVAARLAAERASDAAVARLRATILPDPQDVGEKKLQAMGNSFHSVVAEISGNERLRDLLLLMEPQLERCRAISYAVPGRGQEAQLEHFEVLSAIEKRDADQAERLMRVHLVNSLRDALRSFLPSASYSGALAVAPRPVDTSLT